MSFPKDGYTTGAKWNISRITRKEFDQNTFIVSVDTEVLSFKVFVRQFGGRIVEISKPNTVFVWSEHWQEITKEINRLFENR